MEAAPWYIVAGMALVVIGLSGVAVSRHPIRKILAVNIMGSGVFLLLVAPADRVAGRAPDPVPHAMVLTGIVVAVSATALALALARRLERGPTLTRDGSQPPSPDRSPSGRESPS